MLATKTNHNSHSNAGKKHDKHAKFPSLFNAYLTKILPTLYSSNNLANKKHFSDHSQPESAIFAIKDSLIVIKNKFSTTKPKFYTTPIAFKTRKINKNKRF